MNGAKAQGCNGITVQRHKGTMGKWCDGTRVRGYEGMTEQCYEYGIPHWESLPRFGVGEGLTFIYLN